MILIGETLGARQKYLNFQVNDAASNNVSFQEIKENPEENDADKLFKIDLAGKYKNVDYIIEVLKCADSLYISRALKFTFLYDDEFASIINPANLHDNILPFMSRKMKKKLLSTISMNVRNEERAKAFHQYCIKAKLQKIASKFLIFTSGEYKTSFLENDFNTFQTNFQEENDIKFFIGNNTTLAGLYLEKIHENRRPRALYILRYLYLIDPNLYLNWVEQYCQKNRLNTLGLRISKDIMKNHKNRVIGNFPMYCNVVNKNMLVKYMSSDDAKVCIPTLLPDTVEKFWNSNLGNSYEFIINLIPTDERYMFIKSMFVNKYPGKAFEMSSEFYNSKYYRYMSVEERETWALLKLSRQHIPDYKLYRFVKYDKAIIEIKKLIYKTPSADKRSDIINVLVESANNQRDLENLFKYYYDRHVNERQTYKEQFLKKVIYKHKTFEFDESCWAAFEKFIDSLDIYNSEKGLNHYQNNMYRLYLQVSLLYYISNGKELTERLKNYVYSYEFYLKSIKEHVQAMDEDKAILVYRYLLEEQVDILKQLESKPYDCNIQDRARNVINNIEDITAILEEKEPDIVTKFKQLDSNYFFPKKISLSVTESDLLKLLKKDPSSIKNNLEKIKHSITNWPYIKLNVFLKKLKIYFTNDLAQDYLKFLIDILSTEESSSTEIMAAVFGIFQLADETYKAEFMAEKAPSDGKIDHSSINRNLLYTQGAICRFAGYSRKEVPQSELLKYIKRDYVSYCLPLFNMYPANFPLATCLNFVESLLDSAVSVQKHALRLAFQCFSIENLKNLIQKIWKTSKNISLRMVIYTYLFKDILGRDNESQCDMFDLLLALTLDLNKDDHPDIIDVVTTQYNRLPCTERLRGAYVVAAWKTLSRFSTASNPGIKERAIRNIQENINLINKEIIREILDDYFNTIFKKNYIAPVQKDVNTIEQGQGDGSVCDDRGSIFDPLNMRKFDLAVTYIKVYNDEENFKSSADYVNLVVSKCLEYWNVTFGYSYLYRDYCRRFINALVLERYLHGKSSYTGMTKIFENILHLLQQSLPLHKIYIITWSLRLVINGNKILVKCIENKDKGRIEVAKEFAKEYAIAINEAVTEYVQTDTFIWLMVNEMVNEIQKVTNEIVNELYYPFIRNELPAEYLQTYIALELSAVNTNKTIAAVFALKLVRGKMKEAEAVYKNLKAMDDITIQTLLYINNK
ncbi:uncharacterized protein LOC126377508 [Pectinophora gossypiella]|uniref:Uncharacterized protein n=1 Tax=Pectinophora gossypiella TaxID=13191 RepID=A0A1E1WML9_PECGO|nr:uncharacterized protein LOC126377508 [Pectinophora gossypiella]